MKTFKSTTALILSFLMAAQSLQAAGFPLEAAPAPFSISIPSRLGFVSDVYAPRSGPSSASPSFIFLQDLHVNRSVQFAISGILKYLKNQNLLPAQIAVEGATGPMDVASMQAEPDARIRKEASDYLVEQGEMPGAMHFVVTEGHGGLYGVETDEVYKANLEVYRRTFDQRIRLKDELGKLSEALPLLRRNPAFKEKADILAGDIDAVARLVNTQTMPHDLPATLGKVLGSIDRLKQVLPKDVGDPIIDTLSAGAHFYAFAMMRNEDLFQNALALRQEAAQTTTVLITGGFHTKGLTEECKAKGLSYVVITPNVRVHNKVDEKLYTERLLGHHLTAGQVAQGLDWVAMDQLQVVWNGVVAPLFDAAKAFAKQPLSRRLRLTIGTVFVAAVVSVFPGCSSGPKQETAKEAVVNGGTVLELKGGFQRWADSAQPALWSSYSRSLSQEERAAIVNGMAGGKSLVMEISVVGEAGKRFAVQLLPEGANPGDESAPGLFPKTITLVDGITTVQLDPAKYGIDPAGQSVVLHTGPQKFRESLGNGDSPITLSNFTVRFIAVPRKGAQIPIMTLPQAAANAAAALVPQAPTASEPAQPSMDPLTAKARQAFESRSFIHSDYYESRQIVGQLELDGWRANLAFLSLFFAGLFYYGTRRFGRRGSASVVGAVSLAIMAGLLIPVQMVSQTRAPVQSTVAPKQIKSLQDAVDFIRSQRAMGGRGLPRTFWVAPGTNFGNPNDPQTAYRKFITEEGVGLYDTSLDLMALAANGNYDEAFDIINIYNGLKPGISQRRGGTGVVYGPTMELEAFPKFQNQQAFPPFTEALHYYFNFTRANGIYQDDKKWDFWQVITGENSWFANALAYVIEKSGRRDANTLRLARQQGDSMMLLQDPAALGGIRMGPNQGVEEAPSRHSPYFTVNSENQVSAIAAYRRLARVTGDRKYEQAAGRSAWFLFKAPLWNPKTRKMQEGMFDPDNGLLYVGAVWNPDTNRWEIEADHAEDSSGSWTISALGPATIDEYRGPGAAYKMWLGVRNTFGRTSDNRHVGPNDELAGVDFKDYPDSQALRTKEWSAGAYKAVKTITEHYARHSAPGVDQARLTNDLASLQKHVPAMSNAYATGPGMHGQRNGFTGWGWFALPDERGNSAMASIYYYLPFDPLAVSDAILSLVTPTAVPVAAQQQSPRVQIEMLPSAAPEQAPGATTTAGMRPLTGSRSTWPASGRGNPLADSLDVGTPFRIQNGEELWIHFPVQFANQNIDIRLQTAEDLRNPSDQGNVQRMRIGRDGILRIKQSDFPDGPYRVVQAHSGNTWLGDTGNRDVKFTTVEIGRPGRAAPPVRPAPRQQAAAAPAPQPQQRPAPAPAPQRPTPSETFRGQSGSDGSPTGDHYSYKDGSFNLANARLIIALSGPPGTKVMVQLLPRNGTFGSQDGLIPRELTIRSDGTVEIQASESGLSAQQLRDIKQISVKSGKHAYFNYTFGESNGIANIQGIEIYRGGRAMLMDRFTLPIAGKPDSVKAEGNGFAAKAALSGIPAGADTLRIFFHQEEYRYKSNSTIRVAVRLPDGTVIRNPNTYTISTYSGIAAVPMSDFAGLNPGPLGQGAEIQVYTGEDGQGLPIAGGNRN